MTRVNVRVRPAGHADVPAMVELMRSVSLPATPTGSVPVGDGAPERVARRLADVLDTDRIVLVADGEGEGLEGVLVARHDSIGAVDLMPVLHVTHLAVSPQQRRRGVGRTLLAAAVHLAEEAGVDHVMVTAVAGARESNRYLARLGFAPLVTNRVASTSALHRSLGMSEHSNRVAVLRRARRLRALGPVPRSHQGGVGRGA